MFDETWQIVRHALGSRQQITFAVTVHIHSSHRVVGFDSYTVSVYPLLSASALSGCGCGSGSNEP